MMRGVVRAYEHITCLPPDRFASCIPTTLPLRDIGWRGALQERAYVCHAPDQHRLDELLGGSEPLLLFVDLRMEATTTELLPRLVRLYPHAVVDGDWAHPGQRPFYHGRRRTWGSTGSRTSRPSRKALREH